MPVKEFLSQVQRAETELRLIAERRAHFEDLAASVGGGIAKATLDKPSGGSRVETAAIGLVDLLTDLDVKEREYAAVVKKAEELIGKLPQQNHRVVLTLRYILNRSWSYISNFMNYKDPKSVYRVHGWALQELQKLM